MEVLPDGRIEHVFHQSWLGTYFTCPEQARAKLAHELPPDLSEASAKGHAVHAAIEAVLRDCVQPDEALSLAFKTFREESAEPHFRWVKVKTENTCLSHIEGYFASWWDYVYPTLGASVWIEHEFRHLFHEDDERVIYFGGTADYAEFGRIYDWKTTMNKDKYGTRFGQDGWEQKRWAIQPTFYSAAYYREFLTIPEFVFVALDNQGREPQLLPMTRSLGELQFLVRQSLEVARFIETAGTNGPWPLRDQHVLCSPKWCMKWDDCKGGYVDEEVPALVEVPVGLLRSPRDS